MARFRQRFFLAGTAGALLLALVVVACGGGEEEEEGAASPAATAAATATEAVAGTPEATASAAPMPSARIAFVSNRDGNLEIYVMNADGSGQTNLTNNPALDRWTLPRE